MSKTSGTVHAEPFRVVWAKTHGAIDVLNGHLRIAKRCLSPTTEEPCPRQVRIQHKGLTYKGVAVLYMPDKIRERESGGCQRDRIIFAQHCRPERKSFCLGKVMRVVTQPAT